VGPTAPGHGAATVLVSRREDPSPSRGLGPEPARGCARGRTGRADGWPISARRREWPSNKLDSLVMHWIFETRLAGKSAPDGLVSILGAVAFTPPPRPGLSRPRRLARPYSDSHCHCVRLGSVGPAPVAVLAGSAQNRQGRAWGCRRFSISRHRHSGRRDVFVVAAARRLRSLKFLVCRIGLAGFMLRKKFKESALARVLIVRIMNDCIS
jgi:hypothetical protein